MASDACSTIRRKHVVRIYRQPTSEKGGNPIPTLRIEATPDELKAWLKPSATTTEQIKALEGLGLAPAEVAHATKVTVHALRGWATGSARPRPSAAIKLDDLRATAKVLLDDLDEPERVANWLRGWNERLEARPLDLIASSPGIVRDAAFGEAISNN